MRGNEHKHGARISKRSPFTIGCVVTADILSAATAAVKDEPCCGRTVMSLRANPCASAAGHITVAVGARLALRCGAGLVEPRRARNNVMNKALKVILIIGVCLVVLAVAGVGAGMYWWAQHKDELLQGGQRALDEGHEFGAQTNNEGCVAEALTRNKREPGFSAALSHNLFLRSCLEASKPSPAFCDTVPDRTEFMKSAQWQQQKCQAAGLATDTYCSQLFTQVQQFCEAKRAKSK